jgi:hypothetical protein
LVVDIETIPLLLGLPDGARARDAVALVCAIRIPSKKTLHKFQLGHYVSKIYSIISIFSMEKLIKEIHDQSNH